MDLVSLRVRIRVLGGLRLWGYGFRGLVGLCFRVYGYGVSVFGLMARVRVGLVGGKEG